MNTQVEYFNIDAAKELIKQRANQLVNTLMSLNGHGTPPFRAEELAKLIGVTRIERVELGKTSGMLLRIFREKVIKLNSSHNQVRQNFSCAHEIGHIIFGELGLETMVNTIEHRTYNPLAEKKARSVAIEKLCDFAATELLMPQSIFSKYLLDYDVSINTVETLASIFEVSIQSAAIRISELNPEKCTVLKWQKMKGSSKSLRLAWPNSIQTGKTNYIPKERIVSAPSSLHKAYEQSVIIKSYKNFKFGKDEKRLQMESKGFGSGENRYVLSVVHIN